MSDVECPNCKEGQDICHDDGQGYQEDVENEQACDSCGKHFKFVTSISYCYDVFCPGDHDLEQNESPYSDLYDCKNCDYYEVRR